MSNQCNHGQLARVCLLCEQDQEIERLRAENKRLQALAEFGEYAMRNWTLYGHSLEVAVGLGLAVDHPDNWYELTDLAQLLEE